MSQKSTIMGMILIFGGLVGIGVFYVAIPDSTTSVFIKLYGILGSIMASILGVLIGFPSVRDWFGRKISRN